MASAGPITMLCVGGRANCLRGRSRLSVCHPAGSSFRLIRARGLGGRVAVPGHGRQYYRMGPSDFFPSDGLSTPWPLRHNELDPWYALVERRLGLSGTRDHLPWLPDGELLNFLSPTPAELKLRDRITARWSGVQPILGRYAPPLDALEGAAQTGRLNAARVLLRGKLAWTAPGVSAGSRG